MSRFSLAMEINNYDCDIYGKLRPANLMKYLGEAALKDSMDSGDYIYSVENNKKAWMIYKWKVEIIEELKAGDFIEIETWISKIYKFYANREYMVYSKGRIVAKISSLWIYIDTKRKLPSRIPAQLNKIYNIEEEYNFKNFEDLDENLDGFDDEYTFKVRKSDIDYNKHVNNSNYINWMIELVPLNLEEKYDLSKINVTYKREVLYDEDIVSKIKIKENKDNLDVEHRIYDLEGKLRTLGNTLWNKA